MRSVRDRFVQTRNDTVFITLFIIPPFCGQCLKQVKEWLKFYFPNVGQVFNLDIRFHRVKLNTSILCFSIDSALFGEKSNSCKHKSLITGDALANG